MVVNCFQIVFLLWSLTTNKTQCSFQHRCELLPNCIFTVVFDNLTLCPNSIEMVVNCFQIVFLLWSLTTFKSLTFNKIRCELLSNCIFTVVFDNFLSFLGCFFFVVNCFQIVFLLWSLTTMSLRSVNFAMLWIAFKLYFYCGLWQHAHVLFAA